MAEGFSAARTGRPAAFAPKRLLFPAALLIAATSSLVHSIALPIVLGLERGNPWTYIAGQAAVSWFDTGFARRELAGTLIRLFTTDPIIGTAWFGIITYSVLAALGIGFCYRQGLVRQLILGAALLAILLRLSGDIGRIDAAIMICGLGAAWAAREARWALCGGFLFIALLFHEAGLIELAPLVAAVAWASGSWTRWRSREALLGGLILATALLLYAVSFHPNFDLGVVGRRVHGKFPLPLSADTAVYQNLVGAGALKVAVCFAKQQGWFYPFKVVNALVLALLLAFGLQPNRWRLTFVSTALPLIALSAIAIDVGRWAVFAAFGAFVLAVLLPMQIRSGATGLLASAAAILGSVLMVANSGPVGAQQSIPLAENFARAHWFKGIPSQNLDTCAPDWRTAIGLSNTDDR